MDKVLIELNNENNQLRKEKRHIADVLNVDTGDYIIVDCKDKTLHCTCDSVQLMGVKKEEFETINNDYKQVDYIVFKDLTKTMVLGTNKIKHVVYYDEALLILMIGGC